MLGRGKKRKLFPDSLGDRIFAVGGVVLVAFLVLALLNGYIALAAFLGTIAIFLLVSAYLFQDQPTLAETNEYTAVISDIRAIGQRLSNLSAFLDRERSRIADTESTLTRLRAEQTQLQPIVSSQRETVDAILAAYSKKTASNVWKERLFGFVLGLLASLAAGVVYDFLR